MSVKAHTMTNTSQGEIKSTKHNRTIGGGMDFSESHIRNLFEISRIVYNNPAPAELCSLLATRVCPTGEVSKVYLGSLRGDGFFRTITSFGYSIDSGVENYEIPIDSKRPIPEAYKKSKIVITKPEVVLSDYPDFVATDLRAPWSAIVAVPMYGGGYIFVFRLQGRIEDFQFAEIYFEAIRSILSHYRFEEHLQDCASTCAHRGKMPITDSTKSELFGKDLTKRQETILALIRLGHTNASIAEQLSYSESLIRQETVVIYAKLGVTGRRELLPEEKSVVDESSEDSRKLTRASIAIA